MNFKKIVIEQFIWRGLLLSTQFIIQLFLARIMGAADNGNFLLLLNNLSLAILILGLCLETSAIFYGASYKIPRPVLASFMIGWNLAATFVCLTILILTNHFSSVPIGSQLAFFSGYLLLNTTTGLYQSEQNFKTYNQVQICGNFIFLCWLLYNFSGSFPISNVHHTANDLENITNYYTLSILLQGLIVTVIYWVNQKKIRLEWPSKSHVLLILQYASQSLASNLIYFLLSRVDYWIVNEYCNQESLGIYIQATKIGQLLILPAALFSSILFPQASKNPDIINSKEISLRFIQVAVLYLILSIVVIIFGSQVIRLLWGEDFDGIYTPLIITLPGIFCFALSYFFAPLLAATGKVYWNILVGFIVLIIVVISNFIAIPIMGINGAALSTSLGFIVMLLSYFIIAKKQMGLSFSVRHN